MSRPGQRPPYRQLDHTADVAVIIYGDDMADLLNNAAVTFAHLTAGTVTAPDIEDRRSAHPVELVSADPAALLVDLLNELIFVYEVEALLTVSLRLDELSDTYLRGTLSCLMTTPDIIDERHHLKAATMHDLKLERVDDGLSCRLVFDV